MSLPMGGLCCRRIPEDDVVFKPIVAPFDRKAEASRQRSDSYPYMPRYLSDDSDNYDYAEFNCSLSRTNSEN